MIWGALCQRSYAYEEESESFSIPEGALITECQPIGYKKVLFKLAYPDRMFKGEYLRITLFLTSSARKTMSEAMRLYNNIIKRVHTDGFILEENSENESLINCSENASKTLGALKFEKEGKCYVKNANQVAWV